MASRTAWALPVLLAGAVTGCASNPSCPATSTVRSPMRGVEYGRAAQVIHDRYPELRREHPQIVGAGVVDLGGSGYGIRLSLSTADGLADLPADLDGVPLRYQVTGPYRAQGEQPC
ncbi:MAG: hypothetical protein HOY71_33885 [Nonomuraea sp.]|nr:hypothetical protein [Nonomuraea sp.]